MKQTHIWLRAETKPLEQRTALTPKGARALLDAGFRVTVEDGAQSIFATADYRSLGCDIAAPETWRDAPREAFILGLKELPEDSFPLEHRHIYFAHVFKRQAGADGVLQRFVDGGGALYDLEYLTHGDGRRVAAFGYWAGFSGAAIGVLAWANKAAGGSQILDPIASLPSKDDLVEQVRAALAKTSTRPTVMVIGAKGRSGHGAIDLSKAVGLTTVAWDIEETRAGGPFTEIIEADVFVNCVLVNRKIPPFVTRELLAHEDRRLAVIVDVSCDPYGPFNPLPVYDRCTSFEEPSMRLQGGPNPLDLIAIDNLPSLLPRESSEDFGEQLVPCLVMLDDPDSGSWQRAHDVFVEQTRHLRPTG
jgi:saccharopine dehydrogenase (NAD+, L-lysine-forming)